MDQPTTYNANIIDSDLPTEDTQLPEEISTSDIPGFVNGLHHAISAGITKYPTQCNADTNIDDDSQYQPPEPDTIHNNEQDIPTHEFNQTHKEDFFDDIFNKFKIPICLMILYYGFHTNIVNKYLFTCLTWTCSPSGNINNKGIITMSILFGLLFILMEKIIHQYA